MSTRTQNRGRIRTANGVERQQNNQSGVGYNKNYNQNNRWNSADNDQRNSSKQDRNTSGWRKTNTRGNHASNNRDGTVPLWKTNEGRNSYAQSLGVSGPSRNRSQNQELFEVPGNRRGGARGGHKPPGAYNYNMYNTYNTEGRNWPQQEPASASLTNSQVPRHSQYNPATSRPGQPILDRFGSRENPVNISTARNLLQEEYDIQAAEYAAKNREKEIKKLQEKMMRLRFCSAYDLGHRLSDTRDISPEAREKMVQNLQAEYNNQAKIYAAQKKELEEKKAELERAKKIEKYQQSPIYRDVLQDQEQRPKESTGAVPKQKLNDNFYEKKKKYKSEAVSQPVSQPTVTSNQRTLMDAIDVLSKPSTSSNQKKLDTPVKPLILSRSKRTSTEFVTTGMSPAEFIEKVTGVSVLSKFVPSTSDSNLKEARKRMQEKLDEQLALKKKEEVVDNLSDFAPSASDNNLKEARWRMQHKLDQQLALKKQDEGKQKNESNENVKPSESSIQQPLPLEKADATTRCFSSQSSLNIDFKEIDTIQIPNLGKITTTTTTDNPVLVLRPLEVFEFKGSEADKSVDDVSKKSPKRLKLV